MQSSFDDFVQELRGDFDSFCNLLVADFAEFVRNPWQEFQETAPVTPPPSNPVPPAVFPAADTVPDAAPAPRPVPINDTIIPKVAPLRQPKPYTPIREVRVPRQPTVSLEFFGTPMTVRCNRSSLPRLGSISEEAIASALEELGHGVNDNTILDCLALRREHNLSDWAYLLLLQKVADEAYGESSNEASLFLAYLYMRSGYKMRLAMKDSRLYALFASRHLIFNKPSFSVDGDSYYCLDELPQTLQICRATFPGEKPLSLLITGHHKLAQRASQARPLRSRRYPMAAAESQVNRNMLDFYATYPSSTINYDVMTSWSQYANAPMDSCAAATLYPALRAAVEGKTKSEGTEILLNFVQTAFEYATDNEVWGTERVFFAEETLFYPYSDCEDRAILFTRLVRDLLGLDCLLLQCPRHLAAAVAIPEQSTGDYVLLNGRRYTIADPTYINAPVGKTMPGMSNQSANAILLE